MPCLQAEQLLDQRTGAMNEFPAKMDMNKIKELRFIIFGAKFFFVSALASLICFPSRALPNQSTLLLENRAGAFEIKNEGLLSFPMEENRGQEAVAQKDIDTRNKSAEIRADIAEIKDKIKRLTGRIDELEHNFKNKTDDLKTSIENMNRIFLDFSKKINLHNDWLTRLRQSKNPESKKNKAFPEPESVQEPGADSRDRLSNRNEPGPDVALAPKKIYESSKEAFDKKDFETAKKGFHYFLKKSPASFLAGESHFWIGEIYYLEKKYEKAIIEYQNVIEKYPESDKTSAALLKQGLSFAQISDKQNASLFFNEVVKRFPGSEEAEIAAKKLRKLR